LRFTEIIENLKKEAGSESDKAVANIPLANKDAASAAVDLTERARQSILACRSNCERGSYAKAAEDLQQEVELPSKAFGLLTGTLKPTDPDMKLVGHDSYKSFILHY
jgi:hypothetical protein